MCIYIRYSMSIIEKVFHHEENEISVIDHKYNNTLTFKIENEMDLHVKVVSFLKKRYPHSLFTVTLGENQDTVHKRIDSFTQVDWVLAPRVQKTQFSQL